MDPRAASPVGVPAQPKVVLPVTDRVTAGNWAAITAANEAATVHAHALAYTAHATARMAAAVHTMPTPAMPTPATPAACTGAPEATGRSGSPFGATAGAHILSSAADDETESGQHASSSAGGTLLAVAESRVRTLRQQAEAAGREAAEARSEAAEARRSAVEARREAAEAQRETVEARREAAEARSEAAAAALIATQEIEEERREAASAAHRAAAREIEQARAQAAAASQEAVEATARAIRAEQQERRAEQRAEAASRESESVQQAKREALELIEAVKHDATVAVAELDEVLAAALIAAHDARAGWGRERAEMAEEQAALDARARQAEAAALHAREAEAVALAAQQEAEAVYMLERIAKQTIADTIASTAADAEATRRQAERTRLEAMARLEATRRQVAELREREVEQQQASQSLAGQATVAKERLEVMRAQQPPVELQGALQGRQPEARRATSLSSPPSPSSLPFHTSYISVPPLGWGSRAAEFESREAWQVASRAALLAAVQGTVLAELLDAARDAFMIWFAVASDDVSPARLNYGQEGLRQPFGFVAGSSAWADV
jgi:hypothetical protein